MDVAPGIYTEEVIFDNIWGPLIWGLLVIIVEIVIGILWVKPRFSSYCAKRDWQGLVDHSLKIGSIRIPTMVIMGALLEIFGYGWGGAAVLGVAIVILIWAPVKFSWKVTN